MQVPDEVRKCVVFLLDEEAGEMLVQGTAFFVAVNRPGFHRGSGYWEAAMGAGS
jgi:hypothetical protein